MSLLERLKGGYTEAEREELFPAYDPGEVIHIEDFLEPVNGELITSPVEYTTVFDLPDLPDVEDTSTQDLIDRFNSLLAGLGGQAVDIQEQIDVAQAESDWRREQRAITTGIDISFGGEGEGKDGFGGLGLGVGVGALAALVLFLALGSRK